VGEDLARRGHPQQLALELGPRVHEVRRDHAVLQAPLLLVDVEDEEVQRRDALDETALDPLPLAGGDDPGHEVEGKDALDPLLGPVDGEGDALVDEGELLQPFPAVQLALGERLERGDERRIVAARNVRALEHLVECATVHDPAHVADYTRPCRAASIGVAGRASW
jgi:hypothetical protein